MSEYFMSLDSFLTGALDRFANRKGFLVVHFVANKVL
jgi:hypothetical protein